MSVKYSIEEIINHLNDFARLKNELGDLKCENEKLKNHLEALQEQLGEAEKHLEHTSSLRYQFTHDPASCLNTDLWELIGDRVIYTYYLGGFKLKSLRSAFSTLHEVLKQSDDELMKYRGIGATIVAKLRKLEASIKAHEPGKRFHSWEY